MRQLIDDHLEPEGVLFGGIDCMMTSICTDRSLPDVISDYGLEDSKDAFAAKYGPNRFERLLDYVRIDRMCAKIVGTRPERAVFLKLYATLPLSHYWDYF